MFRKTGRIAVLAATLAAVGTMSVAAVASAAIHANLNSTVTGSLTPKALGQAIKFPEHEIINPETEKGEVVGEGTFKGEAVIEEGASGITGTVKGVTVIPPFTASITLLGIPTKVGTSFTQVGETSGTIASTETATCSAAEGCVELSVPLESNLGVTSVGLLGITLPTKCETVTPGKFALATALTLGELIGVGAHFSGSTTIPKVKCGGILGALEAPLLNSLLSGPATYTINIVPVNT